MKVVIIGAGFAGLQCARCLSGTPVDVLLIHRNNYPVRTVFRGSPNDLPTQRVRAGARGLSQGAFLRRGRREAFLSFPGRSPYSRHSRGGAGWG